MACQLTFVCNGQTHTEPMPTFADALVTAGYAVYNNLALPVCIERDDGTTLEGDALLERVAALLDEGADD